jgi:hypothetical protein
MTMNGLRITAIVIGALLIAFGLIAQAGRYMDGPLGPLPGGALERGQAVPAGSIPWDEFAHVETIELQLLEPARSRTTWIVEYAGAAYVPCGAPGFWLWKQWPHEAIRDGRALMRTGDRRMAVQLVKIDDGQIFSAVRERVASKYGSGGDLDPEMLWIFRLDPRS